MGAVFLPRNTLKDTKVARGGLETPESLGSLCSLRLKTKRKPPRCEGASAALWMARRTAGRQNLLPRGACVRPVPPLGRVGERDGRTRGAVRLAAVGVVSVRNQ